MPGHLEAIDRLDLAPVFLAIPLLRHYLDEKVEEALDLCAVRLCLNNHTLGIALEQAADGGPRFADPGRQLS
ncbi:MAG TPA: hypothetical protein VFU69_11355 [Ktedonobacterales bacterium]|nr:hypothetical protein [Ktedonobacterales bacterium]